MGIPLVEGRYFTSADRRGSTYVAIVNETAARQFPDGRAIGGSIRVSGGDAEVVGVVADVKHRSLELSGDSELYLTMQQVWAFSTVELLVRTRLPVESVVGSVNAAIQEIDPQIPTDDIRTLSSLVERSVSPRRFTLQVLVAFGLSALLLAAVGIYGVLSYSVSERLPELGIRMALGESAGGILRGILAQTAMLAGIGIALGVVIALALGRLIDALLFGVGPTDPVTFVAIASILLAVALGSGLLPALRASRTDSAGVVRSLG